MTTRCKIHHGGGGGVCAPCLRERLLALSAAQNEASPGHHRGPLGPFPPPPPPPPPLDPPPLALPRSVSPYVPRRRSDAARRNPSFLFFRSPQVGPSGGGGDEGAWIGEREKEERKGIGIGGGVKFSVLSTLFGRSGSAANSSALSRSRSWLSALVRAARRKKPPETGSPAPGMARRSLPVNDRGMSPEEEDEDDLYGDGESGCSRESPWLHPTPSPMRRGPRRHGGGVGGGVSGFAVCLSPLVRPSPARRRSRRSRAAELDFSGDLRCRAKSPPPRHHRGAAAALGHCRSRKLGELGRIR